MKPFHPYHFPCLVLTKRGYGWLNTRTLGLGGDYPGLSGVILKWVDARRFLASDLISTML